MKKDRTIIQVGATGPVATFKTTYEAQKETGINQSNISKCLRGILKKTGGYRWVYADEYADAAQQEKGNFWLWSFIKKEDQLFEIIVADYNATKGRKRKYTTIDQIHHLVPKYLYFTHQLLEADNYTKTINCHVYAEITADSPSNFKNMVNAWLKLGAIEITRDNIETIGEGGKKEYTTREYRLTPAFQGEFKQKRHFDETDGRMIADMIAYNASGSGKNLKRKRGSRKKYPDQEHLPAPTPSSNPLVPAVTEDTSAAVVREAFPQMSKERAFHNIQWVLDGGVKALYTLSDTEATDAIVEELTDHPMASQHMNDLMYWLPDYMATVFLPGKRAWVDECEKDRKPENEPTPPQARKRLTNEQWEQRHKQRLTQKEAEADAQGMEHSVISFDVFDL
ncbi:MAG: hypothetical protein EOO04_13110 [Chitinophagaceae bacterium]|nr:MAG: hypothetical protein EOO04_13110 [Chitinophagaceae bacterium]